MGNAARVIGLMRPGTVFCNLLRREVVDETALLEALRGGRLAGAGLDVFAQEPLPPDSPIAALENVVITPHVAGFSEQAVVNSRIRLAEAARDALEGRVPASLVNPEVRQGAR